MTREQRGLRAGLGLDIVNMTQDCCQTAPRGRRSPFEESGALIWTGRGRAESRSRGRSFALDLARYEPRTTWIFEILV